MIVYKKSFFCRSLQSPRNAFWLHLFSQGSDPTRIGAACYFTYVVSAIGHQYLVNSFRQYLLNTVLLCQKREK